MQSNNKIDVRREKMLDVIQRSPVTTINELAEFFSVSAETVRKDIEYLDEQEVWGMTDLINGIMVFPNVIALFALRKKIHI